jgi:hypothetical protein
MNQLEFQNRLASIKQYIEVEYQLLIKESAPEIASIRGNVEKIVLQVADDQEAVIETKIGTITFNGQPISENAQYEQIIAALHRALGEQPSQPPSVASQATAGNANAPIPSAGITSTGVPANPNASAPAPPTGEIVAGASASTLKP